MVANRWHRIWRWGDEWNIAVGRMTEKGSERRCDIGAEWLRG